MYKYLIISLFLCSFIGVKEYSAQYRDPFSEKVKKKRIKKKNGKGLFTSNKKRNKKLKNGNDPFVANYDNKGVIGLNSDPFTSKGRSKYKPTGVDKKSFSKKQRKKAYDRKYNVKNKRNKEAEKSRNNYIRIRYK